MELLLIYLRPPDVTSTLVTSGRHSRKEVEVDKIELLYQPSVARWPFNDDCPAEVLQSRRMASDNHGELKLHALACVTI